MRIVLADDALVLRTALRRLLHEAGHAVVGEAMHGAAALAAARQLLPDAVIVDGRLPPAGAVETIARLRRSDPRLAIYVVAALRETDLVRSAAAAGASGVILRPLLATQIAAVLSARARGP